MYRDGDTVWGNIISTGGGPGLTVDPYVNFPIKDNTIHGNVIVGGRRRRGPASSATPPTAT